MHYSEKTNNKYSKIYLIVLIGAISIYVAYYYNTLLLTGPNTDLYAHIQIAKISSINELLNASYIHILAYPLFHISIKILHIFTFNNYNLAAIFCLIVANIATILIVRKILTYILLPTTRYQNYYIDFFSITSIFVMGITPLNSGIYYIVGGGPNPWHNPTLTFVRPFGLLAFYFAIKAFNLIENHKKSEAKDALISFSIFLFLSCSAKPSYAFVLLPGLGLYIFIQIIKKPKRFFSLGLPFFLSVIPSIILLFIQYIIIFNFALKTSKIIFSPFLGFGSTAPWSVSQVFIATISVLLLVLYTFFFSIIKRKLPFSPEYSIALLTLLFGWIQAFLLSMQNLSSGDFFWGYFLASHLAIVVSIAMLLKTQKNIWVKRIGVFIYLLQVFFGFKYFFLLASRQSSFLI